MKIAALALCAGLIAVLGSVGTIVLYPVETPRERRLTTDTAWQGLPDIHQDRVVWTDFRGHNVDIYCYDLGTGRERRITTNGSVQWAPRIFGDIIAWTDYRNGEYPQLGGDVIMRRQLDTDVFYYDLSTGRETQITKTGSNQTLADVWGFWIFYYELEEDSKAVWYYDTATGENRPLNISGRRLDDLAVHGTRLVYGDIRGPPAAGPLNTANEDIFMYDLATEEERRITTNPEQQTVPDIFEDRIVWSDWRNFDRDDVADNYLFDLGSGREVRLTSDRDVSYPKVSDEYVVYIQYRNHHRVGGVAEDSLFAYDLRQGREIPVRVPAGTKESVEIWGSRMVWSELRDPTHGTPTGFGGYAYNADIYLLDLSSVKGGPGPERFLAGVVTAGLVLAVSVVAVRKWMAGGGLGGAETGGPKFS